MLRSMTGFGKADSEYNSDVVSVEVSSVNHRYLDCSVRLPSMWSALEPFLKETVRKALSRGKVYVTVNRKRGAASRPQTVILDRALARQYLAASTELVQMIGTMETLSLSTLMQMEGVLVHEEPEEDIEKARELVAGTLEAALERLNAMRAGEGRALEEELTLRVTLMREALGLIEQRLPEINSAYEERLRARIDELKGDVAMTEERVAIEIALMADKGDVTEEVVRLKTHLDHALELLAGDESVGRELNFLSQEFQREVNTLGSKVRDCDVTKEVLRMKSELERFREQVQNIE